MLGAVPPRRLLQNCSIASLWFGTPLDHPSRGWNAPTPAAPLVCERGDNRRAAWMTGMDRTLVERARQGDHAAFAILAESATNRLYGVATLILRDPDRAQDAVQEALISAWRDVRALRSPDAWDAWIHRLVVRACYREADRHRRRRLLVNAYDPPPPSVGDGSADLANRDEIERGFRRLTVEQRAILVLHFHVGLSAAEAGDVLGIPEGTAKSRLNRALHAMRAALDSDARTIQLNHVRPA
jgi:RNA polymerase sigma-70 factor (ECF subfamily)